MLCLCCMGPGWAMAQPGIFGGTLVARAPISPQLGMCLQVYVHTYAGGQEPSQYDMSKLIGSLKPGTVWKDE